MTTIETTMNYELFQRNDFNRDIKKTRSLESSMRKHGFIHAYPLHVVTQAGKFLIKAGHHRFHVARQLGLPVAYVISEDIATIHELEAATNSWSVDDYLTSFAKMGNPHYVVVREFHRRTGIGSGMCISMLAGELAASGNHLASFKAGTYVVKDPAYAETVADLVNCLQQAGIRWAAERICVCTLSRIVMANCLNLKVLKSKIMKYYFTLEKKPSQEQFLQMWEKIYNRGVHGATTPLVCLVNDAIRERTLPMRLLGT